MQAIQEAILNDNLARVRELLQATPRLVHETTEEGVPMTFWAAELGREAIVRYLLEYTGVSLNLRDARQQGILHYAAKSGHVQLCKYLVERAGMSPVAGDIDLNTPYEIADSMGHTDLTAYFESVVGAPLSKMYKNPIRSGFFPDPSILRVGDDYYMVNSTFVFFPCIPVSHSKDLIHWHVIGHAITNPEWAGLDDITGGNGYWAPDISYYQGRFYITVTFRHNDIGPVYRHQIIVSSDKPEGPYSKPAVIDEDGIDPSLFADDDGRRYMLLNRGARMLELNQDATERISDAEMLYYGDNKRNPEGPHLLKKDGYYYLLLAEGGTGPGHMVTIARSKTLRGTYEPCPFNPIMTQKNPEARIQRCGHGDLVEAADGTWYMPYLCGRKYLAQDGTVRTILGRETAMDPVTWTADGWPMANHLQGPSALQVRPNLPETLWPEEPDAFDEKTLFHTWMFPRSPEPDGYQIHDGKVTLKGSKEDLDSIHAKNILLRRQTGVDCTADCVMEIPVLVPGQSAGMVSYYDELTYIKWGVFCMPDGRLQLQVLEKIADQTVLHPAAELPAGTTRVWLRMTVHIFDRSFAFSLDGNAYSTAVELPHVEYLCDEGVPGKRFTGPLVGMYAHAGQTPMKATFDSFRYRDLGPSGN